MHWRLTDVVSKLRVRTRYGTIRRHAGHATFRTGLGNQTISQIISLPLWHALYVSARYKRQPWKQVGGQQYTLMPCYMISHWDWLLVNM